MQRRGRSGDEKCMVVSQQVPRAEETHETKFTRDDTGGRRGRPRRAVYASGYGGYYLNRNRNSWSVLGIGYAIARARPVHINQIRDGRRVFYRRGGEGEEEKEGGCSSLISSTCAKINTACVCTRTDANAPRMTDEIARNRRFRIENRAMRLSLLRATKTRSRLPTSGSQRNREINDRSFSRSEGGGGG